MLCRGEDIETGTGGRRARSAPRHERAAALLGLVTLAALLLAAAAARAAVSYNATVAAMAGEQR